jgi:dTDP-glucose 4,6-dehydratase
MTVLVTGGAGFIGSNFVLRLLNAGMHVVNLDKLTYAGRVENLAEACEFGPRHQFVHGDIGDGDLVLKLLSEHRVRWVVNMAAESHVDRSIMGPEAFIQTNVLGTFRLLEAAREYFARLPVAEKSTFRFLHVSTDEVYGSLGPQDPAFTELNRFEPNSPYSASKASSDHLVRAYHGTYGLPVLTTNCSNNYGPYQLPEKLIPLVIHRALSGERIPVYGDGLQIRDWLYVGDHCAAIQIVLERGDIGHTYNVGGRNEVRNIEVVKTLCRMLDLSTPRKDGRPYAEQIEFVRDRPGHDRRYAVDASKIANDLDWAPAETFETGIEKTVTWYLKNSAWVEAVAGHARDSRISSHYAS